MEKNNQHDFELLCKANKDIGFSQIPFASSQAKKPKRREGRRHTGLILHPIYDLWQLG